MDAPTHKPFLEFDALEAAHREWREATVVFHQHIRDIEQGLVIAGADFDRLCNDLKAKHLRYSEMAKSLIQFQ